MNQFLKEFLIDVVAMAAILGFIAIVDSDYRTKISDHPLLTISTLVLLSLMGTFLMRWYRKKYPKSFHQKK
jgi:hypothetical protein